MSQTPPASATSRRGVASVMDGIAIAEPAGEAQGPRPGYEGMGLGLFIAKSLLERTGARLTFANNATGGAVAVVAWPAAALAAPTAASDGRRQTG